MKCDNCGRQFPAPEAVEVSANEQTGSPGLGGAPTKIVKLTLCPACAHGRRSVFWFAVWTIVAIAVALVLLNMVGG
jgi:hypothetical protein